MSESVESIPWYLRERRTRRLLVLAEEARLRETLLRSLTRQDFEVFGISSAKELGRLGGEGDESIAFDGVLVDVGPQGAAALEDTLARLKKANVIAPVLCLAAPPELRSIQAIARSVPLASVAKPIDLQEIASELSRLIHEHRATAAKS